MLARLTKRISYIRKMNTKPSAGIESNLRVLRSQSQQAYEDPLVYQEEEILKEMKAREKRLDQKRDEKVKKEQDIRETLEEDEVDLASYDSFPASDPPSSEMTT